MNEGSAAVADALRAVPLLADLGPEVIDGLAERARVMDLEPGASLIREGEEADGLFVVLDGRLEITTRVGTDDLQVGAVGPGEIVGEMALLEHGPRTATVRAVETARTLFIAREEFIGFIETNPRIALELVQTLARRLRSTQAMLEQREKLAALGTLAAGLAHEFNNPAAAMRRGAALLADAFTELERASRALAHLRLDEQGLAAVDDLREGSRRQSATPSPGGALEASDRAAALEALLDELGVDEAWRIAATLGDDGWTGDDIAALTDRVGPAAIGAVLIWLAATVAIDGLLGEIAMASQRISELVAAVKSYTFLDQAPLQDIDVRDGLESTLVIMRHKLGDGVSVVREFAPDLPRIQAYGSELNQVWTNLVDNAIDAMDGRGTLTIRVEPEPAGHVTVHLCDDGPPIPPTVLRRIFEPFYTTKEPGKGTGLGLHISHSIVVGHHGGRITATSEPGATCFHVSLPVTLTR